MPNFYFDFENNRRNFYAVTGNNMTIHIALSGNRLPVVLDKLVNSKITSLSITDSRSEAVFDNSIRVIFNNEIFRKMGDTYDEYIDAIQAKIKKYVEQRQMTKLVGRDTKVNRPKNESMKTMFIASSLGISLLLGSVITPKLAQKSASTPKGFMPKNDGSVAVLNNNEKKDTVEIDGQSYEVEVLDQDEIKTINDVPSINVNFDEVQENIKKFVNLGKSVEEEIPVQTEVEVQPIVIDLSYTPQSIEVSRYKETDEHWGDIIRHYAKRWGLPAELEIAKISQERPNFVNGWCDNICQLTKQYYVGKSFKMPVYDENGKFTGTYDEFTATAESINTYEGNIMAGMASLREYIDANGIVMGLFLYNQGPYSLSMACDYYGVNIEDYKGDRNAIKARDLVVNYYKAQGKSHGDPLYLEHVFSRLPLDERGEASVSCYIGDEKVEIAINNTLEYNMNR